MSLDNIRLNPLLVQQLYTKSLVAVDSTQAPQANKSGLSYLGRNEKKILILVNAAGAAYLPDDELALLVGILTACKLSLADVAVVNFFNHPSVTYASLIEELTPKAIFLFGVLPEELQFPLHFPFFQLQQYNDQTYISAPALSVLAANKEDKKALWGCLQKYISN